jgi:nitroreductase
METLAAILARASYRGKYDSAPVPREHLRQLLEAGLAAPSGCNRQTTSLIAVDDPALLDRLRALSGTNNGKTAPAMILVLTRRIPGNGGKLYYKQDYAAAIENILLAAVSLGYESCWIEGELTGEGNTGRKMAAALCLPEEYELVCFLPIGKAAEPVRRARKKPYAERAWFNGFQAEECFPKTDDTAR